MKKKPHNKRKKTHQKRVDKRCFLPKFLILEAGTLEELQAKLSEAERFGYSPHTNINSAYDQFFVSHTLMVARKKTGILKVEK